MRDGVGGVSSTARRIAFRALRWSGLPFIVRRTLQRRKVTLIAYHEIDPPTLDAHLRELGRRYTFITLRDFADARCRGRFTDLPNRALAVTLDDGLASQYALLDVFRKHAVRPTIFLTAGVVGTNRRFWWTVPTRPKEFVALRDMPDDERLAALVLQGYSETADAPGRPSSLTRAQIEEMRPFVDFQAHTMFHPVLARCSNDRSRFEIYESKKRLQEDLSLDIYAFAYPNGKANDFTERDVAYVSQAGYECAVTAQLGFNDGATSLYRLKRIVMMDDASAEEAVVQASGVSTYLKRLLAASE